MAFLWKPVSVVSQDLAGLSLKRASDLVEPVRIAESAKVDAVDFRNTVPFNTYGLPAISVPCGFTGSGLPIGLQIGGPPFAESIVLALAHAYEQATRWHSRRPNMNSTWARPAAGRQ